MRQASSEAGVLMVVGIDDLSKIDLGVGQAHIPGSTDLHQFMIPGESHRLQVRSDMLRKGKIPELGGYHHILNCITEAETGAKVLEVLRKLLKGSNAKIINRPEAVLATTRDQVARRLAGIEGLVVPRVRRIKVKSGLQAAQALEKAGMQYPLIIRRPGTHTGQTITRFDTPGEVVSNLSEPGDYLAIELVDFADADGVYRKARVFYINGVRVFRHRLASDHWNVHAKDRDAFVADRPALVAEEAACFERPEGMLPKAVSDALDAVRDRIGLDFFGIDFAILPDGRALLFEANATMSFFSNFRDPRFPHVSKAVKPAGDAFRAMLGLPAINIAPNAQAALQE